VARRSVRCVTKTKLKSLTSEENLNLRVLLDGHSTGRGEDEVITLSVDVNLMLLDTEINHNIVLVKVKRGAGEAEHLCRAEEVFTMLRNVPQRKSTGTALTARTSELHLLGRVERVRGSFPLKTRYANLKVGKDF
jgi:hypothetical protein